MGKRNTSLQTILRSTASENRSLRCFSPSCKRCSRDPEVIATATLCVSVAFVVSAAGALPIGTSANPIAPIAISAPATLSLMSMSPFPRMPCPAPAGSLPIIAILRVKTELIISLNPEYNLSRGSLFEMLGARHGFRRAQKQYGGAGGKRREKGEATQCPARVAEGIERPTDRKRAK